MFEETEALLRSHLARRGVTDHRNWKLSVSSLEGRGIFATTNLLPGDVVFIDAPLVLGPRAGMRCHPVCVGCHRGLVTPLPCSRGCGLPVCCTKCENSERHEFECRLLSFWRNEDACGGAWSRDLLRAVTPLRCLALSQEDKDVLRCLKYHAGSEHGFEVKLLRKCVNGDGPTIEDEEFMKLACYVMDANAFETSSEADAESSPSLRGLYPLSSILNHACTPNTRRSIDEHHNMVVRAATHIPEGAEVTTSYTSLLWATPARRYYLTATKHFWCKCSRCTDPQEGGSMLSALKCSSTPGCEGSMLCVDPLTLTSDWSCNTCGGIISHSQSSVVQKTLGSVLNSLDRKNVDTLKQFLKSHRHFIATTNQFIVELKCNIIILLGNTDGYSYEELSEEDLSLKENLCEDILKILEALKAGECGVKGHVLYELSQCLAEQGRRILALRDSFSCQGRKIIEKAQKSLQAAERIFVDDITAPTHHKKVVLNGKPL